MKKMISRLISLLLAWMMLLSLTACSMAADKPASIEDLALRLQSAQSALTQAEEALAAADQAVAGLEQKCSRNPNSVKLQDQLIDAMIEQEAASEAHTEALAALLALQTEQSRLAEAADCEDLIAEYNGQHADLRVTVTVDADMVIYGLTVEVTGGERDQLVGRNDYLYQFIGKDIPLTIGSRKSDDVAPLADAQQTSKDLVAALNSLIYQEPEESADKPSDTIIKPQAIADYLFQHGRLPDNFITKKEAQALGWDSSRNYVSDVAPGKSIGGDRFGNYEKRLPSKKGRTWYEADCFYTGGRRNAHRILYSSDGLVYYTDDHYETFTQMFPSK